MENRMTTEDILSRCLRQFEDAADSTVAHRNEAEQARDYRDGHQWTAAERQTLAKRKQPIITDNRIADKVEYLLGLERRTRTDPKAYPRNPQDEGSAEAATDAIRYLFDCNDWPQIRSLCFEQMLVEGVAVAEVVRDGKKDKIRRVRWDRFYSDPHSMELDFSDAQYLGVVAWFDEGRLIQKYPRHKAWLEGMTSDAQRTYVETFDDKPNSLRWIDVKRRRIQVFEHYYWDGEWKRAVFCKGGFLEEPKVSPYKDADGAPECPIIAQACYRDRNGNPYGVVRRYKDLQDEINKRRSKALHLLSTQRIVGEKGGSDDINKLREELHKPDGVILHTPGMKFEVQSNADMGMAQFQLLVDAINALNATGPNLAMQGQAPSQSGRAKQLDQEGGAIQVGALFDQIRHFQKRVARATWNRIKQFWTAEMWIRVTDDEQKLKFVGLNVPVTAGEQQVEQLKGLGIAPEEMQPLVMQIAMNPLSQVPVGKKNDVAKMDLDIIVEESPDTITIQQEQFAMLVELVKTGAVQLPGDVLIEASGIRNKQSLLEKIKPQEPTPEQIEAVEMQKRAADAEIRTKEADASKAEADAAKTSVETAVMIDRASQAAALPNGDDRAGGFGTARMA